jgi:hypothetical protein
MKRRALLLLMPDLLALAIILYCCRSPPTLITMANAARIKPGMSRSQIEAILGPARDETGRDFIWRVIPSDVEGLNVFDPVECWASDNLVIAVSFDRHDKVRWVCTSTPEYTETHWQAFVRKAKAAVGWR